MSGKQPRRYVLSTPDGTLVSTKNIIPTRGKLQQVGLKKNNVPTQRGALMHCTFQANELTFIYYKPERARLWTFIRISHYSP